MDRQIVVGMAHADLPVPHVPSRLYGCTGCGRSVWISSATKAAAPDARVMCVACGTRATEDATDVDVRPPTAAQLDELRRYNG